VAILLNVDDLFIPEFFETATVNAVPNVQVISAEVSEDVRMSELGADMDADAAIVVRLSVSANEDDLVSFRGRSFRIARAIEDSAALTKRLYLVAKYGGAR